MNYLHPHIPTLLAACLLLAISIGPHLLPAQSNRQPYFRNYTTDNGLASPEIHDIIQDNKGYIWIATDNGVSRFDGYQFKNYSAKEGLNNNVVFHLQADEQDRIWMQTMSGKMYYYLRDSIHPYPYNHIFEQYLPYLPQGFIMSENEWSYFALSDLGLLRINPKGEHEILNKKLGNSIMMLEKPELESTLYSIASNAALDKFGVKNKSSKNLLKLAVFSDTLQEYDVRVAEGITRSSGFSDKTHQIFDFRQELQAFHHYQLQARYPLPAKVATLTKKDSTFWIGLNDKLGVWAFPGFSDVIRQNFKNYLYGFSISAIGKDRLGGYWFGSLENGVFYAPNLNLEIIEYPGESANEKILSLETWHNGQLLLGTDEGTLYAMDGATGSIRKLHPGQSPVFDLFHAKKDASVWITGRPFLIFESGKVRELNYAPEFQNSVMVSGKTLTVSRDSNYIYSLTSIGLEIIDRKNEQVVFTTRGSNKQERFLCAFEDYESNLWIGSPRGLIQFKNKQFLAPPQEHDIFDIRIEAIDQLADSTLVLGSKGKGVALWKDSSLTIIDENMGLTSNMVENLVIDYRQQIWIGTLNGLNVLSRSGENNTWRVKRLTMAHGLPSNEINALCPMNGSMYVATSRGLVKLPLVDDAKAERITPFFESILVNGKSASPEKLTQLKSHERNIQLQFVCLNFKFKENIPYRYRLTSDPEWSYTLDRSVNYASLAPGTYLFEVQAQNEDGVWSESLSIPFSISVPIWQRWWFIFLAVAGMIGLVYYWYRRRLSRLRKEAAIEREINELQRSALQAQMNPHFIFNCLNSIQNFIASGNKASAMEYLARFANLVRTTLNASIETTISLEEEVQVLENYLELEKLRFGNRFEYTILVDPQLEVFETTLPPLLVQPFVENSIIHGFNFEDKTKVGNIHIAYEWVENLLQITIRDNGIGMERSRLKKEGKEKLRTSLGMSITQKRLSLQNQTREEAFLKIKELVDQAGTPCGTEIIIRIKF